MKNLAKAKKVLSYLLLLRSKKNHNRVEGELIFLFYVKIL